MPYRERRISEPRFASSRSAHPLIAWNHFNSGPTAKTIFEISKQLGHLLTISPEACTENRFLLGKRLLRNQGTRQIQFAGDPIRTGRQGVDVAHHIGYLLIS